MISSLDDVDDDDWTSSPADHSVNRSSSRSRPRPASIFTALHLQMAPAQNSSINQNSSPHNGPTHKQQNDRSQPLSPIPDSPSTGTPGMLHDFISEIEASTNQSNNQSNNRLNLQVDEMKDGQLTDPSPVFSMFGRARSARSNNRSRNQSVNNSPNERKVDLNDLSPGSQMYNALLADDSDLSVYFSAKSNKSINQSNPLSNAQSPVISISQSFSKPIPRSISRDRIARHRGRRLHSNSGSSDEEVQPGSINQSINRSVNHSLLSIERARKLSDLHSDRPIEELNDCEEAEDDEQDDDWFVTKSPKHQKQSIDEPINESNKQSNVQSNNQSAVQSNVQSNNQSAVQSNNRPADDNLRIQPSKPSSINHRDQSPALHDRSASLVHPSINQSVNQSRNQSLNHPPYSSIEQSTYTSSSLTPLFPPLPMIQMFDSVDTSVYIRQGSCIPPMILELIEPQSGNQSINQKKSFFSKPKGDLDDREYFRLLLPQSISQAEDIIVCRKKRSQLKWRFSLDGAIMSKRGNDGYIGKMKIKQSNNQTTHFLLSLANSTPIANIHVNHAINNHAITVEMFDQKVGQSDCLINEVEGPTGRKLTGTYMKYGSPLLSLKVAAAGAATGRIVLICDRVHINQSLIGSLQMARSDQSNQSNQRSSVGLIPVAHALQDSKYSLAIDYPLNILTAFAVLVAAEADRVMREDKK